jgi:uncharacterized protein YbjT (DUF2867 family)
MKDEAEQSIPSRGSQPFAWAADIPGKFGAAPTVLFGYTEKLVKGIAAAGGDLVQPFPLYRSPVCPYVTGTVTQHCTLTPFTLTDAEREAIRWAIDKTARTYDDPEGGPIKRESLRTLLERTK